MSMLHRRDMLTGAGSVLIAGAGGSLPARAAERSDVVLGNSRVIDFTSSINGHSYRINVALPFGPPPPAGYRAIYHFDGNLYVHSLAEAVRANGNAVDVVVVGIGYPETEAFGAESDARRGRAPDMAELDPALRGRRRERWFDLTLPATDAELIAAYAPYPPPRRASEVGGVDLLLKTIEADVKPRVAQLVPIDPRRQALFGHSLGGLSVLRALFRTPDAFTTFIAASPSIWWNRRAILADEAEFTARVVAGKTTPRILITVGADEQSVSQRATPGMTAAQIEALNRRIESVSRSQMVSEAQGLAERLKKLKGALGYEVELAVFPQQGHGISVWPAIGRSVEFAFQR